MIYAPASGTLSPPLICQTIVCLQMELSEFMDSLAEDNLLELTEQSTQDELVDIAQGH